MRGPSNRPGDTAREVARWGAFSCVLVPLTLVVCGSPWFAAAGTTVGLALLTLACRALLHQSERTAARLVAERTPHRGRHSRTGTGAHRGGRRLVGRTPAE